MAMFAMTKTIGAPCQANDSVAEPGYLECNHENSSDRECSVLRP